jgi:RNA ligase (TIGR02306 family)
VEATRLDEEPVPKTGSVPRARCEFESRRFLLVGLNINRIQEGSVMSTFRVEVTRIDEVLPHPNADRLELVRVRGWKAVAARGAHTPGETVVYIPEDAVVPQPVLEALGLTGKLAGKEHNRVKAIRLRGELSQGLLMSMDVLHALTGTDGHAPGTDVAEALGITRYEEPIPAHLAGTAIPWPVWMSKYTDIENIKNFPGVLRDGEPVVFTEKLHGACAAFGMTAAESALFAASRNLCLARDQANAYWRVAAEMDVGGHLRALLAETGAATATLYGELLGVQDLKYGFVNGRLGLRWFDVSLDGEYQDHDGPAHRLLLARGLERVPVLYQGAFSDAALAEHTDGSTVLGAGHVREGVVVRAAAERYDIDANLGRVILKSVSGDYLTRKGQATEYH